VTCGGLAATGGKMTFSSSSRPPFPSAQDLKNSKFLVQRCGAPAKDFRSIQVGTRFNEFPRAG
jgi:hypothetical protein